jgi:hypothetical protein
MSRARGIPFLPCEPPSSGGKPGEVGEDCLSPRVVCEGEFRSHPAWRAAQGSPKDRRAWVPFSLVTFFWASKRKSPAAGLPPAKLPGFKLTPSHPADNAAIPQGDLLRARGSSALLAAPGEVNAIKNGAGSPRRQQRLIPFRHFLSHTHKPCWCGRHLHGHKPASPAQNGH